MNLAVGVGGEPSLQRWSPIVAVETDAGSTSQSTLEAHLAHDNDPRPIESTWGTLATEAARKLYRRRAGMVEPVYAQTKYNQGIRAFTRRGLAAVTTQWQLIATAHNLLRLFGHQPATT